jgi:hypothetical protein
MRWDKHADIVTVGEGTREQRILFGILLVRHWSGNILIYGITTLKWNFIT